MSMEDRDTDDGTQGGAAALLARAAAADVRAADWLRTAIDDLFLPEEARLDDRTRAAAAATLDELIAGIEATLRDHLSRALAADDTALAERLCRAPVSSLDRLVAAGLAIDTDLLRDLIGRVRQDMLAQALPADPSEDPERASLLPRLTQHPDPSVATTARALLVAESRRRGPGGVSPSDLAAELHQRVVWTVAAALRQRFAAMVALPDLDRALGDAARAAIAAHDPGDGVEAIALRLAAALDWEAEDVLGGLVETLGDRRLTLFIATLAQASGLDYADVREIVLDPGGERLWLLLRGLELDRASIARIGLALSDADPRRDLERFADSLDAIVAVEASVARDALAPFLLPRAYRAAVVSLGRGR